MDKPDYLDLAVGTPPFSFWKDHVNYCVQLRVKLIINVPTKREPPFSLIEDQSPFDSIEYSTVSINQRFKVAEEVIEHIRKNAISLVHFLDQVGGEFATLLRQYMTEVRHNSKEEIRVVLNLFHNWYDMEGKTAFSNTEIGSFDKATVVHSPDDPGFSSLAKELPGIKEKVLCPARLLVGIDRCNWPTNEDLLSTIIHLNDTHRWTREKIAEWVESLDIDTTFKVPDKEKVND